MHSVVEALTSLPDTNAVAPRPFDGAARVGSPSLGFRLETADAAAILAAVAAACATLAASA
jgi:hypothetical protein